MTHNEKRVVWYKEGLLTLVSGAVFGASSVIVGHPWDTIKTKLQAQREYMGNATVILTCIDTWKKEGLLGFYRGAIPPFFGSIMFRSLQFSIFESVYDLCKDYQTLKLEIPGTFGLQPRVILGGFVASVVRSVIECPIEYAKVKRQTGQTWEYHKAYKGFPTLLCRTTGMLTMALSIIDSLRRNTNWYQHWWGQFLVGGVSASVSWIIIWPIENVKNMIQAETKGVGTTPKEKIKWIINAHGVSGLYRGIVPGVTGVFLRSGVSMYCMQLTNRKLTEYGFRK
jgi:solute carrier family 25 carnitine/acylcarnitine transporter 20/29